MKVIIGRTARFGSLLGSNCSHLNTNFLGLARFIQCPDMKCSRIVVSDTYPRYLCGSTLPLVHQRNTVNQLACRKNVADYCIPICHYSESKKDDNELPIENSQKKLSLVGKMKELARRYWYILIPVHVITSLGWVAIFYTSVKMGVDIVKILEFLSVSEKYLDMIRNSSAGVWAVTYVLYKIFTPFRYTLTIGLTTLTIRHLTKIGVIKPLSFGKQQQIIPKTTDSNKTVTLHMTKAKTEGKPEGKTEPPKS